MINQGVQLHQYLGNGKGPEAAEAQAGALPRLPDQHPTARGQHSSRGGDNPQGVYRDG